MKSFINKVIALFLLVLLGTTASIAQIKVGGNPTTIDGNAILEVESTNKGILLPRVSLTSLDSPAPLTSHTLGMQVYNLTNDDLKDLAPGIYFNDGSKWVRASSDFERDMTEGNGAPTGACSTPGTRYTDDDENSSTFGHVWTCSGGVWVPINQSTPSTQSATAFSIWNSNVDAGSSKTSWIWRKNGILFTKNIYTGAVANGTATELNVTQIGMGGINIQNNTIHSPLSLAKSIEQNNARFLNFSGKGIVYGGIQRVGSTSGVSYLTTSDQRLKENIRDTRYSINDLMKIEVKDYNYKIDSSKTVENGFIAQQLHPIYPTAVTVGGDDATQNPWTVDYGRMTPLLVKAIQDQQQQIEAQKTEIQLLKTTLEERLAKLEGKQKSKDSRVARKKSSKKAKVLFSAI